MLYKTGIVLTTSIRGSGFDSRWGQRSLVMELVNIYHSLSCSLIVEIKRLYMLFLFVLIKLRHCWYNLALVLTYYRLADECGEARAKPCMFHYAKACVLDCTCRLLRFVNDCNKRRLLLLLLSTCCRKPSKTSFYAVCLLFHLWHT